MAQVIIEGNDLVVRLTGLEQLGAFHRGDIHVPRVAITNARVVLDPWTELRGIRAPGTDIPDVIALGTRRGRFGRDFAAVYGHRPGIVIECTNTPYRRLILTDGDPESLVRALRVGAAPA